jgi:hypothetical protein
MDLWRTLAVAAGHDGPVAPKSLTSGQSTELARSLRALLDIIRRNEMTASTAMVYRLDGAVTAVEAVVGDEPKVREQR